MCTRLLGGHRHDRKGEDLWWQCFRLFALAILFHSILFLVQLFYSIQFCWLLPFYFYCILSYQGPRRGRGWGGLSPPPHFFENYKELLRKKYFQPPHFESLVSSPTFKVAPRALPILFYRRIFVYIFCLISIRALVSYWEIQWSALNNDRVLKDKFCQKILSPIYQMHFAQRVFKNSNFYSKCMAH